MSPNFLCAAFVRAGESVRTINLVNAARCVSAIRQAALFVNTSNSAARAFSLILLKSEPEGSCFEFAPSGT